MARITALVTISEDTRVTSGHIVDTVVDAGTYIVEMPDDYDPEEVTADDIVMDGAMRIVEGPLSDEAIIECAAERRAREAHEQGAIAQRADDDEDAWAADYAYAAERIGRPLTRTERRRFREAYLEQIAILHEADDLEAEDLIDGWTVADSMGGRWWPDDEAAEEIETSDDPAATALRICREQPMRGRWHQ